MQKILIVFWKNNQKMIENFITICYNSIEDEYNIAKEDKYVNYS